MERLVELEGTGFWGWRERELGPGKDLDLVIKSRQGVLSKGSLGGRGADWEWEVG